ncbi:MAG TPA: hypothetical protein VHM19_03315 [Polyangiales bacterium]|jgi:hypothetical protein|nr:hypothetical protein [Polyangiales bacterium]
MHLVALPKPVSQPAANATSAHDVFVGSGLVVVFAEADEIARVREAGSGLIALQPPYHMSEEDTYLLLPDDIGEEIVDILRDGDSELLAEAMRDGLLVQGEVGKNPRGPGMVLDAELACSVASVLGKSNHYAAHVAISAGADALRALNTLPHVQCTTLSALVDDDGLESMLRADEEFIGCAWRPPASVKRLSDIEPTYAWSRRIDAQHVGIELALFREDEELVAVLRPARLSL